MTSAKTLLVFSLLLALFALSAASPSPLFGLFSKKPPGGQFGGPPPRQAYSGFGQGGPSQGGGFGQRGGFSQGGFGQGGFGGGPGGSRF